MRTDETCSTAPGQVVVANPVPLITQEKIGRLLIASAYFPPVTGGSSTTVANFASALMPDFKVRTFCRHPDFYMGHHESDAPAGIAIDRFEMRIPSRIPYARRITRKFEAPFLRNKLRKCVDDFQPTHIVGIYPDSSFLKAAFRVAKTYDIPFFPYFFDAPDDSDTEVIANSSVTFSLTEGVNAYLKQHWGISSVHLPHAYGCATSTPHDTQRTDFHTTRPTIIHSGVIESLQIDGIRRIISAIHLMPDPKPRLVLSTPAPEEARQRLDDVWQPWIETGCFSAHEVRNIQRSAAVQLAILPLDQDTERASNTNFPTKIIEYLQAGRPILVHAPADSFLYRHADRNGYAACISDPNPEVLSRQLAELVQHSTPSPLIEAGQKILESEFSPNNVKRLFLNAI